MSLAATWMQKKNPWRKKRNLPDSLFLLIKLGCFISIRRYLKATPIYEFPFCRTLGRKSGNVDDTKVGMIQSGCLHINGVLLQQHVHGGGPSREWQNSTHFAFRRVSVCQKKWENWHHQEKGGKLHRLRMQNKIMRHVGTHRDMLWQHFKIGKERGPHPLQWTSRSNFSLDFSRLLVSTLFHNIQMMYKTEV